MSVPKNTLPNEFINGIYVPAFLPEDLSLNEFIMDRTERSETVQMEVQRKVVASDTPVPLTEEEAAEVDLQIAETLARVRGTLDRIATIRGRIDAAAAPADSEELSFTLDISKKGRIKRAVRKIFGVKTHTITFSMYKQAIEARKLIEREQANNYTRGRTNG